MISCSTAYHTARKKKGEQCDCPKDTKVKKHKTQKYK